MRQIALFISQYIWTYSAPTDFRYLPERNLGTLQNNKLQTRPQKMQEPYILPYGLRKVLNLPNGSEGSLRGTLADFFMKYKGVSK